MASGSHHSIISLYKNDPPTPTGQVQEEPGLTLWCHFIHQPRDTVTSFPTAMRYVVSLAPVDSWMVANDVTSKEDLHISLDSTLNFGARQGVETRTSWKAPVIWEGMFDPKLHDQMHIQNKSSVALTVFAVG
ncbi:hypothetical protein FQN60_011440, partial [Etheostoma spectabile]